MLRFPQNMTCENSTEDVKKAALDFVQSCRRILGSKKTRTYENDLQQLAEHFNLTPIAFINKDDHWLLVRTKTEKGIEVYDPLEGLRELELTSLRKILYFIEKGKKAKTPEYFLAHDYELPRKRLEELGKLQEKTEVDCGPLCLFAAQFAKNS